MNNGGLPRPTVRVLSSFYLSVRPRQNCNRSAKHSRLLFLQDMAGYPRNIMMNCVQQLRTAESVLARRISAPG